MKPTIGRIVTYIVGDYEAKQHPSWGQWPPNGHRDHPAIVTAVWNDTCVNLQVLFDAQPVEVRTSVMQMPEMPDGVAVSPEASWWKWPDREPRLPAPVQSPVLQEEDEIDDREAALRQGLEAYREGIARDANPHGDGTTLRPFWDRGWLIGQKYRDAA